MLTVKWIPQAAAIAFFIVIFLQVPLFRTGVCTTPLEVAVGQMGSSEVVPAVVLKGFLYPGAILRHLFKGDALAPVWSHIFQEYNMTNLQPASAAYRFRLEVVAGSYFAVGGAIISVIKPGRMGMFGMLMTIWGLIKDRLFQRPEHIRDDPANLVHAHPMLFLALALALLSVRYDMQKVRKLGGPIARPMRNSSKSKLKAK